MQYRPTGFPCCSPLTPRRWLLKDLVTSPMPTAQPTLPARARPIPSLPLSIKQQQPQPKPLLVTSSLSLTRKQSQQQKLLPRTSHWNAPARVSSKRPAASRSRRVASSSSSSFQKSLSCVSIIQPSSSSAFSSPYSNDSDDDSSSSGSRIAMDESGLFALPRPVKSRRMNGDERLLLAAATANTEAALRACSGVSASSDAVPGQLDDLLSRVPHFTGKDNIKRISPETVTLFLLFLSLFSFSLSFFLFLLSLSLLYSILFLYCHLSSYSLFLFPFPFSHSLVFSLSLFFFFLLSLSTFLFTPPLNALIARKGFGRIDFPLIDFLCRGSRQRQTQQPENHRLQVHA